MSFTFGATGQQAGQGMSGFNFNQNQPAQQQNKGFGFTAPQTGSTGFGFGAATTTASTGFSFGAPTTAANTGFAFGAAQQPAAPASGGFSFGASTAASTPNTGFAFNAPAATAPSLMFAPTATTTSTPSTGFGFGTTATVAPTGFGFGAATSAAPNMTAPAANANTGFTFGTGTGMAFGQVAQTQAAPSSGFNFGPAPAATTAQSTGFNFAPAASTTPGAFNLSQPSAATTSATTGFGGFSAPATTSSFTGFGPPATTTATSFGIFSTPASSASTGFNLGTAGASMPTPLSFGPASSAPTATLGVAPVNTVAPGFGGSTQPTLGGGFQMGGAITAASSAPSTAPFGTGGFNFSTPLKTAESTTTPAAQFQLPTVASSAPTGLTFGINTASTASIMPTTTPAPLNFSLSTTTSKSESTANSILSLSKPVTATAPLSGLGSAVKTQASSLSLPTSITSSTTAPAFAFTPATSASTPSGFAFPTSSSTSTTSAPGFSFPPSSTTTSTATTTTAPSLFGIQTALSTASSVSSAITSAVLSTTTTVTSSVASPASINFRQLEETINKWKIELEEQEKVFLNQATQVNAWDRLLISNGEKITILNDAVEKVKLEQQRLDLELDFIFAQQSELEELLGPLEKSMESTPNIHVQQHADLEREHTYHLAENIDAQLKRMSEDIREIIEHVNTANKSQNDNDPVHQIVKILNAHMDALHWVDQNTVDLQRRLEGVSKIYETQKRENEKTFRGTF